MGGATCCRSVVGAAFGYYPDFVAFGRGSDESAENLFVPPRG